MTNRKVRKVLIHRMNGCNIGEGDSCVYLFPDYLSWCRNIYISTLVAYTTAILAPGHFTAEGGKFVVCLHQCVYVCVCVCIQPERYLLLKS